MLQSLPLQSSINANPNPSSESAMKTKRIDRESVAGENEDDQARKKRSNSGRNLAGEATVSGEKPVEQEDEPEEDIVMGGESTGLRLLGLLLQCAEAVAMDNLNEASDLLPEISELSSPFGSSPERVAAYFAEALQARIISSCLGTYGPLNLKALTQAQNQRICHALQSYNSISPLIKFSHFTANQAIFQALEGEDRVHVIDLDIMQGLQWPGLFHILASRSRKVRSVRITGVGSSIELLEATGRRLSDFASSLGLPFESGDAEIAEIAEAEVDHDRGTRSEPWRELLGEVRGSLALLLALFDALGDGLGGDSLERHQVEAAAVRERDQEHRGRWWAEENRRGEGGEMGRRVEENRFRLVSLSGNPAAQASLLLGMFPWKGYTLVEENGVFEVGMERSFFAYSLCLAAVRLRLPSSWILIGWNFI
ncbi:hypothetical protein HHK36_004685 [Tetracentron sinense]|uniref:Scarecrow-like protein 23 n=1 Tax=Tetracentron sinense TaxID=13715 RepID=A0A834ZU52_TETSI|nr:hypothetical protein HHK36_004685 [Tetracentron sinense]